MLYPRVPGHFESFETRTGCTLAYIGARYRVGTTLLVYSYCLIVYSTRPVDVGTGIGYKSVTYTQVDLDPCYGFFRSPLRGYLCTLKRKKRNFPHGMPSSLLRVGGRVIGDANENVVEYCRISRRSYPPCNPPQPPASMTG